MAFFYTIFWWSEVAHFNSQAYQPFFFMFCVFWNMFKEYFGAQGYLKKFYIFVLNFKFGISFYFQFSLELVLVSGAI